jgi:hypothetical protein
VGLISSVPQVIVVNPQRVPVTTCKACSTTCARTRQAQLRLGRQRHLAPPGGELFKLQTKTFITHIPTAAPGRRCRT